MKRAQFGLVGLMLSVSFTSVPFAHATFTAQSATSALTNTEPSVAEKSPVRFDGQWLSGNFVKAIAKDPVIAWGIVRDESGNEVQGEVWLIVSKGDKFLYYHLTEEPSIDSDPLSYSGYAVSIIAVLIGL